MAPNKEAYRTMSQNIMNSADGQVIKTITLKDSDLGKDKTLLGDFNHVRPIGISPGYSEQGKLIALAIADDKICRIVEFAQPKRDFKTKVVKPISSRSEEGRRLVKKSILGREIGDLYAFDMAPLAMSLYFDLNLRIINAIDIQSGYSAVDRKPIIAIKAAVGDSVTVYEKNVRALFEHPVYNPESPNDAIDLAMRAWVSQFIPAYQNGTETFEKVPKIDTMKFDTAKLNMIAKIANDTIRLDQKKPMEKQHRVDTSTDAANGNLRFTSKTYHGKFRGGENVRITSHGRDGRGEIVLRDNVAGASGKSSTLSNVQMPGGSREVISVTSIGRDDPTTAEAQRSATLLRILQGTEQLLVDSPWIQNIWFPEADGSFTWPDTDEWKPVPPRLKLLPKGTKLTQHPLNASQQIAVNTMLSIDSQHRLVLIQGPPGTGKTSVIASFVQMAVNAGYSGMWLVAQSNVAVKNIAEKLKAVGFLDWRILVSKDFHNEWHEHLYVNIQEHFIRSDEFNTCASRLRGCQVVLCTLSMLSNPNISKFSNQIRVSTLVVDEASQIEIGNYVSIFASFKASLRKACFIGDDKQLPPYGQEDLQDLQSIFEVPHLRTHALFLNTQYRMPPQLGNFISEHVYADQLKSNPSHPITDKVIACRFIDSGGKEKRSDTSFMNPAEIAIVLQLAQHFQEADKQYRIITPYDAQRNSIEDELKNSGLEWGNKCFNVDSFQGNEEDYIILSLVRSRSLGFLADLRRSNVMLTRCKLGMFIVTSRDFLSGIGESSLAGELMKKVGPEAWLSMADLEEGNF